MWNHGGLVKLAADTQKCSVDTPWQNATAFSIFFKGRWDVNGKQNQCDHKADSPTSKQATPTNVAPMIVVFCVKNAFNSSLQGVVCTCNDHEKEIKIKYEMNLKQKQNRFMIRS